MTDFRGWTWRKSELAKSPARLRRRSSQETAMQDRKHQSHSHPSSCVTGVFKTTKNASVLTHYSGNTVEFEGTAFFPVQTHSFISRWRRFNEQREIKAWAQREAGHAARCAPLPASGGGAAALISSDLTGLHSYLVILKTRIVSRKYQRSASDSACG